VFVVPTQVDGDALVQATQFPPEHTGVEAVQEVLTQFPALQVSFVAESKQAAVVPVHCTHWFVTQFGVLAGQASVPLNTPSTQALRLPVSAHWETVSPQPLPSGLQVCCDVVLTHALALGVHALAQ
jgi:phage gp37-like protein